MKKKLSREELIELRKRQQAKNELEQTLRNELSIKHRQIEDEERFFENKNRFVIASINFFGTLFILYIPYKIASFILPINLFAGSIKVIILGVAIISAFRKRSLIEKWF